MSTTSSTAINMACTRSKWRFSDGYTSGGAFLIYGSGWGHSLMLGHGEIEAQRGDEFLTLPLTRENLTLGQKWVEGENIPEPAPTPDYNDLSSRHVAEIRDRSRRRGQAVNR